ncbi:MAG: hypothetical protein FWC70_08730 [Defluviitaleaceae bacterium]|nr:hypothetical protein [Defluviitaleaceae bacterium]
MVFFYSRSGKTKVFANTLGEVSGSEVYELNCDLNNKGNFAFIVKALSVTLAGKPFPVSNVPNEFPDEIFLCAPVWGGKIAAPAKYFLQNANLKNTTTHLLLTASMPGKNCRRYATEILSKSDCKPGNVYIFATSDKVDANAVREQLHEMLDQSENRGRPVEFPCFDFAEAEQKSGFKDGQISCG